MIDLLLLSCPSLITGRIWLITVKQLRKQLKEATSSSKDQDSSSSTIPYPVDTLWLPATIGLLLLHALDSTILHCSVETLTIPLKQNSGLMTFHHQFPTASDYEMLPVVIEPTSPNHWQTGLEWWTDPCAPTSDLTGLHPGASKANFLLDFSTMRQAHPFHNVDKTWCSKELETLRPNFAYRTVEVIKRTLENTT